VLSLELEDLGWGNGERLSTGLVVLDMPNWKCFEVVKIDL
jgi:hypothetical protein